MLRIVRPVCCSMDVHQKLVIVTIAFTDFKNVTTYKKNVLLVILRKPIISIYQKTSIKNIWNNT